MAVDLVERFMKKIQKLHTEVNSQTVFVTNRFNFRIFDSRQGVSSNGQTRDTRDEDGLAVDFEIEGEYPQFGNNDARVDDMAVDLVDLNFLHETFNQVNGHVIDASIVVTKLRIFAFDFDRLSLF
jgi:hypothetical protein